MMSFCGNVVELVEKHKVVKDMDFLRWDNTNLVDDGDKTAEIEVFIEYRLISELENKFLIIIDAAIGEINGGKVGMLFMKKDSEVYG